MTTAIVSDLHLGAGSGRDLLRRDSVLAALCDALAGVDELVLLGDVLELREGPLGGVLAAARPALEAIDRAMAGRRVTLLAGNHDHQTAAPLIENLGVTGRELEPETIGEPPAWMADVFRLSELRAAYPGVWVRGDVYATHGHYLDVHNTVPTFERIAIGAVQRATRRVREGHADPADYEAALAPVYSLLYSLAQSSPGSVRSDRSSRVWQAISASDGSRPRALLTGAAIKTAVGALNRAGVGPLRPELSAEALRDSALVAMNTVVDRLGIDAEHVVFGHTHRSGPHSRDAPWGRLINPGSWVLEPAFLGERPSESPYFPGHVVIVPDHGPPELRPLLEFDRDLLGL
jgi:UDP-2,3-diacylglucosamine pyrophosphatase LpxH